MPNRGLGARPKQQPHHKNYRGKRSNEPSTARPRPLDREVQEQEDELLAMASIFEPGVFSVQEGSYSGLFCAHLDLPGPICVTGFDELPGASRGENLAKEYQLKFLPPIQLHFRLPPNYPSTCKPNFKLSCKWLSSEQLALLSQRLEVIWSENKGDVILFLWTAFLTEEALSHLGIGDRLDLSWVSAQQLPKTPPTPCYSQTVTKTEKKSESEANQSVDKHKRSSANEGSESSSRMAAVGGGSSQSANRYESSSAPKSEDTKMIGGDGRTEVRRYRRGSDRDWATSEQSCNAGTLLRILLDHNRSEGERAFAAATFACAVCLEQRAGAQCMAFKGCEHVYCKECMRAYFEVQIEQGNVKCLTCPHDKCPSQALPSQVRELVNPELFAKYDELLLASTLDSMSDVIYCPRVACQCAVLMEPNCTMASCPACSFVFCLFCRMGYHGVEPCKMKDGEFQKLFDTYQNGTHEEKMALESRYGKTHLQRLVEGMLSDSWVKENSKRCPNCTAHIEKNDGCNKMTCWKCNCFFCWLCMTKLDLVKPYEHFDERNGDCFGRLFTGNFNMSDSDDSDEDPNFPEIDENVDFGLY